MPRLSIHLSSHGKLCYSYLRQLFIYALLHALSVHYINVNGHVIHTGCVCYVMSIHLPFPYLAR
jgi:hypothetical protein